MLLSDQQISMEPGHIVTYSETVMRIQNPQGLAAGNISLAWDPATESVTVNKLQIRRGDKVIDVLASGQTFTTLRRETNLDAAMLDGTLTANIQPEGLQEGDIVDFATTTEHSDPVLKGHVEAVFARWNGAPIELGHALVSWPKSMKLVVHRSDSLQSPTVALGERMMMDLTATKIEPLIVPSGAPTRFKIGRIGEASDFQSWSDLADLFIPLFRDASVIPPSGPLRDEVERIRSSTNDPKRRAEAALQLAQDRIRYVALLMGQGGYVPAPAETSWSRRFGDCKAKTALLLGILHSLQIEAEPVLVNAVAGDAIADRLPMAQWFNHVLVRAHIGGKDYWLDGTRTGDTDIEQLQVPYYGWGLPLVERAVLTRIVPAPLEEPRGEMTFELDASKGLHSPATAKATTILRGDRGLAVNLAVSQLTEEQRRLYYERNWQGIIDGLEASNVTGAYDEAKREFRMEMIGMVSLRWVEGRLSLPTTSTGSRSNYKRPEGPGQDVPVTVPFPYFDRRTTIVHMPPNYFSLRPPPSDANLTQTLAGVEYRRATKVEGDVMTIVASERSLMPEISYAQVMADQEALRTISERGIALAIPPSYKPTETDFATLAKTNLTTPDQFLRRGQIFFTADKYEEAIKDFDEVLKRDPKNIVALANRSVMEVMLGRKKEAFDDVMAALAIDPNHHTALRAQAQVLEQTGDCPGAIKVYSKVLETEPTDKFSRDRRAHCALEENNQKLAANDSSVLLKNNPGSPEGRVRRALVLIKQKNYGLAGEQARLLEAQNPDNLRAHLAASGIYERIDLKEEALKAVNRALQIGSDADALVQRARLTKDNERAAAKADVAKALALKPNHAPALELKGQMLAEEGAIDEVADIFETVATLQPNSLRSKIRALTARLRTSSPGAAHEKLKALRSTLVEPRELYNLCEIESQSGVLLEEAEADCGAALRTNPTSSITMVYLGLVYLRQKRFDNAIVTFDHAIEAMPSNAGAYLGRALAYRAIKDSDKAGADHAKAVAIWPAVDRTFAAYGLKW
jgi:tetratricopeptide (TPR) repeat protein